MPTMTYVVINNPIVPFTLPEAIIVGLLVTIAITIIFYFAIKR